MLEGLALLPSVAGLSESTTIAGLDLKPADSGYMSELATSRAGTVRRDAHAAAAAGQHELGYTALLHRNRGLVTDRAGYRSSDSRVLRLPLRRTRCGQHARDGKLALDRFLKRCA